MIFFQRTKIERERDKIHKYSHIARIVQRKSESKGAHSRKKKMPPTGRAIGKSLSLVVVVAQECEREIFPTLYIVAAEEGVAPFFFYYKSSMTMVRRGFSACYIYICLNRKSLPGTQVMAPSKFEYTWRAYTKGWWWWWFWRGVSTDDWLSLSLAFG